ncbi:MAG TPA: ion transporter [Methyloceanibacter sp.]|jgi:voltage-gated sodium channel|nr:ion transporter [Methyloceanibacter sp.]
MMDWLRNVVQDRRTERFIMALIVLNAVTLGLETSASVMAKYGPVLVVIDRIIIGIFVAEILARLAVQRASFFRDGWNIFDVIVVGIALAPATAAFSVLRALRVLRLLRLITAVPALQRVVGGLIGALPGMGSIVLLIGLVFYVSAVMAVNLYGKQFPELFGTLPTSLYTLFTIMTLEGWTNDVVNPIMERHPYAWLFFIPFIVITTFWVLNLFIGIIVNAMQEEHAKAEAEMMHDETAPIIRELQELKTEIAALREEVGGRKRRSRR